ncbi:MAG: peroxiredoxin [Methyloceanibacter sp.]
MPVPVDDGACAHLVGTSMPHLVLPSTAGREVDVGALGSGRTLIYCYPRTGVPGEDLPGGWDAIPGARGCTPQACAFRDHQGEFASLGASVFGLSTQDTAYQRELADRLHLPFEILSDAQFRLTNALRLPTFEVDGMRLIRRLTLVVRGGTIEHVFYPVYPPDAHADEVLRWLERQA